MPSLTPTELLRAASAGTIIAEARVGDLALFVGGKLVCTLPPGEAGVSYDRARSGTHDVPTGLKVFSNDGPGPTFDLSLLGLSRAEIEKIVDAVCDALERVNRG